MGHFISDRDKWWPGNRIPFVVDSTAAGMQAAIQGAIAQWNGVNFVQYVPMQPSDGDLVIFAAGEGCQSPVGKQGGRQLITCKGNNVPDLMHEMGHAAGLLHEQSRPDRQRHVGVNLANIPPEKQHNFEISSDSSIFGEYDFTSLMHYGRNFFAYDDREPTLFIPSTAPLPGSTLSAGDLAALAFMYTGWQMDFPAELSPEPSLRFQKSPAVFPTDWKKNEKAIYALTLEGQLTQIWDNNPGGAGWHLDFPASLAGNPDIRFQGRVAIFPRSAAQNKKSIYAITVEGRLAQIWDTDVWNIDYPAEISGHPDLRFMGSPAVFPTHAEKNEKSIYALTSDGRLAQIWDNNPGGAGWHLDFPAELAGYPGMRFKSGPVAFVVDPRRNLKSIYAITTDGRLAQIWDYARGVRQWNLDFPAEAAGHDTLRFQGELAVFPTNALRNEKAIYALSTDGRMAQIWDNNPGGAGWHLDFPTELAGHPDLRFQEGPTVVPTDASKNQKCIYLITVEGQLVQTWDSNPRGPGWHLDFPANLSGQAALNFHGRCAVFARDSVSNKKSIYSVTSDGRLVQLWDR